jgi:hypothetical protein
MASYPWGPITIEGRDLPITQKEYLKRLSEVRDQENQRLAQQQLEKISTGQQLAQQRAAQANARYYQQLYADSRAFQQDPPYDGYQTVLLREDGFDAFHAEMEERRLSKVRVPFRRRLIVVLFFGLLICLLIMGVILDTS